MRRPLTSVLLLLLLGMAIAKASPATIDPSSIARVDKSFEELDAQLDKSLGDPKKGVDEDIQYNTQTDTKVAQEKEAAGEVKEATSLITGEAPQKNVLICGGAGFIGFHLGTRLVTQGHSVIALDNFNNYYSPSLKRARAEKLKTSGVSVLEADLCDERVIEQLLQTNNFTHVVNLAAQAGVRYSLKDPQSYVKANVQCWVTLLEALKTRSHIKVVYASSSSVYGDNSVVPFSVKNSVPHPQSMYAASKMAAEHTASVYTHLYKMKLVGLRFFTVYGPWGRPDMAVFSFSEDIKAGKSITVYDGGLERDFTFVEDIVDGIVGAMDYENQPGHSIFNLGNSAPVSVEDVVKLLESKSGVEAKIKRVPKPATEIQITYADVTESTKLLGFKAKTSIEQGVAKWMDWFKGQDYRPEFGKNHQASVSNELQTISVQNMDHHNAPEFEMGPEFE